MTSVNVRGTLRAALGAACAAVVLGGCGAGGGDEDAGGAGGGGTTSISVATVANPQMEDMQKLTKEFERENPDVKVRYTVLPENQLRDRITQDVATQGGQYDVATVGTYEVPLWADNDWIQPLNQRIESTPGYDGDDIIPAVSQALSFENQQYAVPFYGESSFLMYRKDLFEQAGLEMPERPTWQQVAQFARRLDKPDDKQYGICLRGLPGWGEIFGPLNTVVNTFGGRWYDEQWNATLTEKPYSDAVKFYVDLVRQSGQPGAAKSGFTECLNFFSQGNAAMWYDATSAAGSVEDPKVSKVAGKVGYVHAPVKETENSGWLWAWSLTIPKTSKKTDAAWKFVSWATSKEYIRLVGERLGWSRTPPGSRKSTYEIPEYKKAAGAFADLTLEEMESADIENPTTRPVPYRGVQYLSIPEWQALGTSVSQQYASAIAGRTSVDEAIQFGQREAQQVAEEGGYKK